MNAQNQIPFIFQENIPRTNQIAAWNAVTPDKMKTWKHRILFYVWQNPDQTYDEIFAGLRKQGNISWGTVVGRLSDWTKEPHALLIATGSRDGKSTYQISPEGINWLEKETRPNGN